jgi:hypothetical protein
MSSAALHRRFPSLLTGTLLVIAGLAGAWAAEPRDAAWTLDHPRARAVVAVQEEVTSGVMEFPEILGTAVGEGPDGEPALVIYADQDRPGVADIITGIPPTLRGVAVVIHMTDKFRALAKPAKPAPSASHKTIQTPPIQLGTSGGWGDDLANGYCCGGTLGSLIQVNGVQYVLSNYHVFEADIVDGGNGIIATTGDDMIQPGLIDVGCNKSNAQVVATLVRLSSLPTSNVDASVAQVVPGMVRADGAILEIGALSSETASAAVNQKVKKSGRTTGLTRSTVSALNATISVAYDNECAGGVAFTKTFTGQIVIANRGSKFLAGGDSGSLMVQDVVSSPKAVGLLYAGSSTSAIANPIGEVLSVVGSRLGGTATMVGGN